MSQHSSVRKQPSSKKEPLKQAKTLQSTCKDMLTTLRDRERKLLEAAKADMEAEEEVMRMIYGPNG